MRIEILGCETFGVRSMATWVESMDERILIDPAVSLLPRQEDLKPHPIELAACLAVRERILDKAGDTDIVVQTHYHHDHYTPRLKRAYEFSNPKKSDRIYKHKKVFAKSGQKQSLKDHSKRADHLFKRSNCKVVEADGRAFGRVRFSKAVPHGEHKSDRGWVLMALIDGGTRRFVFASDTQCVNYKTTERILRWEPTICFTSGPPIYLPEFDKEKRANAEEQIRTLSKSIQTLIIDHHTMRSPHAWEFLAPLAEEAEERGHRILSAAQFMNRPESLLEANRPALYERYPVADDWYDRFFSRDKEVMAEIDAYKTEINHVDRFDLDAVYVTQ